MSDTSKPYVYVQPDHNRAAGQQMRNQRGRVIEEVLPALREQTDRTLDAMTVANEREDLRASTRERALGIVRQRRSKGLA